MDDQALQPSGDRELRHQRRRSFQQPKAALALLAAWALVGAATELFMSRGLFFDVHGRLDGTLGGRAFGWEAVPLAALYIYAMLSPQQFRGVFWIALLEQSAAIVSNLYHWGAGDLGFGSVLVPLAVAAGLWVLVVPHLFREPQEGNASHQGDVAAPHVQGPAARAT